MEIIDDRTFFDTLYQTWAKTCRAEDGYWAPERRDDGWAVVAVARDGSHTPVAAGLSERDADFVTAVHGCLPDLVRRLHSALDEADRADRDRDDREALIAELARGANRG